MNVKAFIGGLIGALFAIVTTPTIADQVAASDDGNLTGAANTIFKLVPLVWIGVNVIGGAFVGSKV